eukprot:GGOE01004388.1.p1 GENE.GGOE01004388.1~~GGOE01004388.1.p1  ORF type:complete len:389 (+),score=121.40 GGOE01004388.1:95-1168(+)
MGHATRSKVMIQHLLNKGHDVKVATSDRAAEFLKDFDVLEIKGLHLKYEDGKVSKFDSMKMNLKPEMLKTNFEQFRNVNKGFMPDICISDYDSFTHAFAKFHHLPILCLDNIQFCARYELQIDVPKELKSDYDTCRHLTSMKTPGCDRYLVISSWPGNAIKPDTYKVPPVLRDVILKAKPTVGSHVLVYQTSTSQTNLIPELQKVPEMKFFVYGFNRDEAHGNVILKAFSEAGFVEDLASSCAVVTNGGYSLISECLFLHKPLCCFPITGQFEQYLNAAYVQKLGYGICRMVFSGEAVREFLAARDQYQAAINTYRQDGNEDAFRAVDAFLEEFDPRKPKEEHSKLSHLAEKLHIKH